MTARTWPFEWIDKVEKLLEVIEAAKQEQYIALDTETVGWESGNERLSLIQIGLPSLKRAYIIDPFAFQDLKPLENILTHPTPLVVAHNASFEERQFARHGIKIRGIRDTLTMARTLRKDLPNHTLKTCSELLLGITISKEEQTSDWSQRPLSQAQLDYAAMDVEIASMLYDLLADMESKLTLDPDLSVEQMMRAISDTSMQKFKLIKEVAPELAFLENRYDMLYQAIRSKLIEGAPPYEGPYGKCSVQKIKKTEINPVKVRSQFPEIADRAIKETVEKQDLLALMKEHGIDPKRIDEVSEFVKNEHRMSLTLGDGEN